MRFDLEIALRGDEVVCLISSLKLGGAYLINFNDSTVVFQKKVTRLKDACLISLNNNIDKQQMQPKMLNGKMLEAKGYRFQEKKITRAEKTFRIIIEYLEGDIPYHMHPGNVREAYLSLERPFRGLVCDYDKGHSTFSKCTLAIKLIEDNS